jgi:hypothetical protein
MAHAHPHAAISDAKLYFVSAIVADQPRTTDVMPPSTTKSWPLTKLEPSEARKTAARATARQFRRLARHRLHLQGQAH